MNRLLLSSMTYADDLFCSFQYLESINSMCCISFLLQLDSRSLSQSWSVPAGNQSFSGHVIQTSAYLWALGASEPTHSVLRWPVSAKRLDTSSASTISVSHALCSLHSVSDVVVLVGSNGQISSLRCESSSRQSSNLLPSPLTSSDALDVAHSQVLGSFVYPIDSVDSSPQPQLLVCVVRQSASIGQVLDIWNVSSMRAPERWASYGIRNNESDETSPVFVPVSDFTSSSSSAPAPSKKSKKSSATASSTSSDSSSIPCGPALLSFAAHWPSRSISLCWADGRWALASFASTGRLEAAVKAAPPQTRLSRALAPLAFESLIAAPVKLNQLRSLNDACFHLIHLFQKFSFGNLLNSSRFKY